ncbi:MAG: penicillin-binding protein 2 [Holosporales bacterium]|jgi:penicillin-binding protein 2|nr:penicillin-binding protein 2 [Holosporales bacterium]
MSKLKDDKRLFTRRAFIFSGIKLCFFISIVSRLSFLQIFRSSHYKLLSDRNRIIVNQILPARGKILDSKNKVLANNKFSYTAILDLIDILADNKSTVIETLIKEKKLDDKIIDNLKTLPNLINRNNRFVLMQEDLTWDDLAGYYILASKIPGIVIEKVQTRYYLYPKQFSHVIGYIGSPTKEDIENSENTALSLPIAKIGKTCIEKEYDDLLFGKSGIEQIEVNSRRQFVRAIDNIESIPGQNINLTINLDLQVEVYNILSEHESSACVVMDVNTGAVLAFVSYPGFDSNLFTKKVSSKALKEYYDNPYKPMINKIISGLYAPGSVFKIVTGLTGLHEGVITEHTRFHCSGFCELGRHKFHCWKNKYGGHGSMNLQEALAQSCDVYFYNVAKLLSPDKIAATARDFGLGTKTGIDLPNEKMGLIPTKKWKKENKKQKWTKGDTFNMSIGQGFVLTTPIQLARMMSILVNGLNPITPYLHQIKAKINPEKLKYKESHIEIILEGLYDVVNSGYGTARRSAIEDPDFEMAGKTGSSQVCRITEAQRKLGQTVSDDYWKKEHAVFVGYAPADEPKYSVAVIVEHGGGGARTAAPIAQNILQATRRYVY